jgi:hypothetical protein
VPVDLGEQLFVDDGYQGGGDFEEINGQDVARLPSAGKIVIVTDSTGEAFLTAQELAAGFGQERVVHKTWPRASDDVGGMVSDILQGVSDDPDVVALVINNPLTGNRFVLDELKNIRDDICVVYSNTNLTQSANVDDIRADLIIQTDMRRFGESYVMQAISMGAETIVQYSFPRHMAMPALVERRDAMKAAAEREGIRFIELETPDQTLYISFEVQRMFITQDLPRQVGSFGVNTAFFGTECGEFGMQVPMIAQTIATGAIFVSTCCPSPFLGYPDAVEIELNIPTGQYDENEKPILRRLEFTELIQAIDEAVVSAGAAGSHFRRGVPQTLCAGGRRGQGLHRGIPGRRLLRGPLLQRLSHRLQRGCAQHRRIRPERRGARGRKRAACGGA